MVGRRGWQPHVSLKAVLRWHDLGHSFPLNMDIVAVHLGNFSIFLPNRHRAVYSRWSYCVLL